MKADEIGGAGIRHRRYAKCIQNFKRWTWKEETTYKT